ncbi:MAG TPA: membrane protein insertion efficiency factor YidD [Intrasporangium sp.]|uniref:membrane protein insertion efficiency factor YidD n=1 Tax=Intrasporangium sp. TaxID=1925024 RepID=UPI002D770DC2|nr:membrane protein insertion efficiency factor YidD [Intrasporangium sp.]HET7398936.1 membrane protein insertion efficiency factor YidD [Intrasporangium sp.]
MSERANRLLAAPLLLLVRGYQRFVSPLTPPTCRFTPSCSQYAVTALVRFGPVKGGWLALRRLGRCHPWNPGGVDEVPDTWEQRGRTPAEQAPTPQRTT